jgi:hypothetical protein
MKNHTHACSLTSSGLDGAKGARARHAREWSAKIQHLALRGHDLFFPFYFLVAWLLSLELYPIAIRM